MHEFFANPTSTVSIKCWKVAGALHRQKGMMRNPYRPDGVQNTVFSCDSGSIGTCQYPRSQIQCCELFGMSEQIKRVINSWQWKYVELSDGV